MAVLFDFANNTFFNTSLLSSSSLSIPWIEDGRGFIKKEITRTIAGSFSVSSYANQTITLAITDGINNTEFYTLDSLVDDTAIYLIDKAGLRIEATQSQFFERLDEARFINILEGYALVGQEEKSQIKEIILNL